MTTGGRRTHACAHTHARRLFFTADVSFAAQNRTVILRPDRSDICLFLAAVLLIWRAVGLVSGVFLGIIT